MHYTIPPHKKKYAVNRVRRMLKRYLHGVRVAGTRLLLKLHMDVMRNWVDTEVEMVSVCVICAVRTVKVWITFERIAQLI